MFETLPRHDAPDTIRLSYKFQRLRERLRAAVLSGEFRGRLPGERTLGKQFEANAKTINKALADLATEGLVIRRIGRGTFVAPQTGAGTVEAQKCFRMVASGAIDAADPIAERVADLLAQHGHRLEQNSTTPQHTNRHTLLGSWPVAVRRETSGLLCHVADPWGNSAQPLDEGSTAEVLRRHLPVVMIGAQSPHARLCSVMPDYCDAGFRLAEHLMQLGCRRLVIVTTAGDCRETDFVVSGASAAAARFERPWQFVRLTGSADEEMLLDAVAQGSACNCDPKVGPTGLICLGSGALSAMLGHAMVTQARARRHLHMAAVTAQRDETAATHGVAHYECNMDRIAEWAVRLLLDSQVGRQPVQAMIPGAIRTANVATPPAAECMPGRQESASRFTDEAMREITQ